MFSSNSKSEEALEMEGRSSVFYSLFAKPSGLGWRLFKQKPREYTTVLTVSSSKISRLWQQDENERARSGGETRAKGNPTICPNWWIRRWGSVPYRTFEYLYVVVLGHLPLTCVI